MGNEKTKHTARTRTERAGEATRFVDALASIEASLAALPAAELATINLDIGIATVTALGCMPELRALRESLAARLGADTAALIERLDLYARAASQANVEYYGVVQSGDATQERSKRAVETRAMLLAITQVLVQRKVVAAEVLENLRGTGSFRNQAHDLQHLVSVLRRASATATGFVSVTEAELDAAEDAARELLMAIGLREQAPPVVSEATDKRQRAWTLFLRTYDELRAAVSYLRWREKDVDSIVPSLYAGRGGRKRDELESSTPTPTSTPAPTPVPLPTDAVLAGPQRSPSEPPVRPGMPGAEPFSPS